jgi:putative hemolysin
MMIVEIAVVAALIACNAFLAMSELAVVSSRRSRLQSMVRHGHRGARSAVRLLDDPTGFLSTVQAGITMVGILAGAFSGATLAAPFADWLGQWAFAARHAETIAIGLIVLVITYVSLIVGELVPKRIALSNPERIAALVAPAMLRAAQLAAPVVWLLRRSTEALLRPFGLGGARQLNVTEDEVRMMIAEGTRAGVFMPKEREMIDGVLRLADRKVSALMTPRQDVVWLDEQSPPDEIAAEIAAAPFSRLPVCRGTLDDPVGIVHAKDLVRAALRGEPLDLAAAMIAPLVVPERLPALRLLEMFRHEQMHIALVVDEYGSTEGIVTLADVLQSITGGLPELGDEPPAGLFRRQDGSWLIDGALLIDMFEDRVGVRGLRDEDGFDTMAGFVLHRMGRLPAVGDSFEAFGGRFEVVDMDGRRVDTILYAPLNP